MSYTNRTAAATAGPAPGRRTGVPIPLRPALQLLRRWYERACQRRALLQMDERMRRDIGVTADEALHEAHKPFWRP